MINTRKIKGRLVELGLTQKDVALALNIAQATVSQKWRPTAIFGRGKNSGGPSGN